jgi:hypothetical protein
MLRSAPICNVFASPDGVEEVVAGVLGVVDVPEVQPNNTDVVIISANKTQHTKNDFRFFILTPLHLLIFLPMQ